MGLWRGACRLVWAGNCERKVSSCWGVMTLESVRYSSSCHYVRLSMLTTSGDELTVRMFRSDLLVIAALCSSMLRMVDAGMRELQRLHHKKTTTSHTKRV